MSDRAPRLLVSVSDATEAAAALAGGADIIDVKDPSRGSLGMADEATLRAVLARCGEAVTVTAALGELVEHESAPRAVSLPLRYAKLGLAGAPADWCDRLSDLTAGWRDRFIAVIYADHHRAASPPPGDVVRWAIDHSAAGLLVDTAVKDGRGLFHWCADAALASLLREANGAGLLVALAGSLDEAGVTRATRIGADIVAVRGAACAAGDRRARVEAARVERLVQIMSGGRRRPGRHAG